MRGSTFDILDDCDEEDEVEPAKSFEYLEDYYEQRQKAFDYGEDDSWVYVENDDDDDEEYFEVILESNLNLSKFGVLKLCNNLFG